MIMSVKCVHHMQACLLQSDTLQVWTPSQREERRLGVVLVSYPTRWPLSYWDTTETEIEWSYVLDVCVRSEFEVGSEAVHWLNYRPGHILFNIKSMWTILTLGVYMGMMCMSMIRWVWGWDSQQRTVQWRGWITAVVSRKQYHPRSSSSSIHGFFLWKHCY